MVDIDGGTKSGYHKWKEIMFSLSFTDFLRNQIRWNNEKAFRSYLKPVKIQKQLWKNIIAVFPITQYHRRIIFRYVKVRQGKMVRIN